MNNDKYMPLCHERLNSELSASDSPIWSSKSVTFRNFSRVWSSQPKLNDNMPTSPWKWFPKRDRVPFQRTSEYMKPRCTQQKGPEVFFRIQWCLKIPKEWWLCQVPPSVAVNQGCGQLYPVTRRGCSLSLEMKAPRASCHAKGMVETHLVRSINYQPRVQHSKLANRVMFNVSFAQIVQVLDL